LLLRAAKNPFMVLGGGTLDAASEARALVETLGAMTALTINAKGVLPSAHPLSLGNTLPQPPVLEALQAADVVLAIGTELGETDTLLFGKRLSLAGRVGGLLQRWDPHRYAGLDRYVLLAMQQQRYRSGRRLYENRRDGWFRGLLFKEVRVEWCLARLFNFKVERFNSHSRRRLRVAAPYDRRAEPLLYDRAGTGFDHGFTAQDRRAMSLFRQIGAYALGLFRSEEARIRVGVAEPQPLAAGEQIRDGNPPVDGEGLDSFPRHSNYLIRPTYSPPLVG
jgi:hypothetical protein